MDAALLDTDTLSELLKQRNSLVVSRAASYLQTHGQFAFSVFTRFEVERGYRDKQASRLLVQFDTFCRHSLVLPLSDAVFDRAADLWGLARRGGHPKGDADLLIAATAIHYGRVLITGNTAHFAWMPGLRIEDWRLP